MLGKFSYTRKVCFSCAPGPLYYRVCRQYAYIHALFTSVTVAAEEDDENGYKRKDISLDCFEEFGSLPQQ